MICDVVFIVFIVIIFLYIILIVFNVIEELGVVIFIDVGLYFMFKECCLFVLEKIRKE